MDKGASTSSDAVSKTRHLVITVHGIRTFGDWQSRLEALLKAQEPGIKIRHYKYGYFSVLAFLIPFIRWLVTRRFRRHLIEIVSKENWDRVDIVAHSFGTHLVGWGLYGIVADGRPKIHTILLSGSVLKPGFPWHTLIRTSVVRLVNDCGIKDAVLVLNQLVVLFTGMAGRVGFNGMTDERFRNRFFQFGHSGYFVWKGKPYNEFMHDNWVPLLTSDAPVPAIDERKQPTGLDGVMMFALNNAEPVKIAAYVIPLFLLTVWIYAQWEHAEEQTRIANLQLKLALSRQLAMEAELERQGTARIWNVRENIASSFLQSTLLAVEALRQYPTVEADRALRLSLSRLLQTVSQMEQDNVALSVSFNLDGTLLATGDADGKARVWEPATGRKLAEMTHGSAVTSVTFSRDSGWLLTIGSDHTARRWDVNTGLEMPLIGESNGIAVAAFSPAGDWLLTVAEDGIARVWDVENGREAAKFEHNSAVTSVVFGPKGRRFATVADDATTHIWEVATWQQVTKIEESETVTAVAIDRNGKAIAVVTEGEIVRLWDVHSEQKVAELRHSSDVQSLAFSPDGRWLATALGARDHGEVLIWEVATGNQVARLVHDGKVNAIAFGPDGKKLVTGTIYGTAWLWTSGPQGWRRDALLKFARSGQRPLFQSEWTVDSNWQWGCWERLRRSARLRRL